MYQNEITENKWLAVPTVTLNGQEFASGRMTLDQIIEQITGPQTATPSSESTPMTFYYRWWSSSESSSHLRGTKRHSYWSCS